jgi:hypothetical protein
LRSRIFRSLAWSLAAGVTGLLVLVGLIAWRMSQGPIALDLLVAPIERALSQPERGLFVRVDRVLVDPVGFLQLQAEGVRVVDGAGVSVAGTPRLRLTLSSRALARGMIAPQAIELSGVRVRLSRSESGSVQLGLDQPADPPSGEAVKADAAAAGEESAAAWIIADLLQPPDPDRITGYLRRVSVDDADVLMRDAQLKRSWRIPDADFELLRGDSDVVASIGGVLDVDGRPQRTQIKARLDLATAVAEVSVSLGDVRPDIVTQILPVLGFLSAFDAPISGDLAFRVTRRGGIENADVHLTAGAGSVGVPGTGRSLPLRGMVLRGATAGAGRFEVAEFTLDAAGQQIAATGDLRWSEEGSRAVIRFVGLNPTVLAAFAPDLAPAAGIDLPLDGWVDAFMPTGVTPEKIAFGLRSDGGRIAWGDLFPEPVRISGLEIDGTADLAAGRLRLDRLSLGLGGPRVEGSAVLQTVDGGAAVQAAVKARDVPTNELKRLWPRGVAKGARGWVLEHLSNGGVSEANARVALVLAGEGPSVAMASVSGEMRIDGVTAVYWDPLPPFEDVGGTATFTEDRFDLHVDGGRYRNIRVRGGDMAFTNLNDGRDREFADIKVDIEGPLSEIIAVLDRPPLGYAKWLGVAPAEVGGTARASLGVQLPLLQHVSLDQIEIAANADLSGVRWPDAALGQDLRDGALKLRLDKASMDLVGRGTLAGAPVELDLHEVFAGGTRLKARATVDDAARRRLGYDLVPYLTGPVDVRVDMEGRRSRSAITARADLSQAALAVSEAGWKKPAGVAAQAEADIVLTDGRMSAIDRFALTAPGASVDGRAAVDPATGDWRRIDARRLRLGERTDLALSVSRGADAGLHIDARGAAIDLAPLIAARDEGDGPAGDRAVTEEPAGEPGPPIAVVADIGRVWVSDALPIDRVAGHVRWHDGPGPGDLRGLVGGTAPVRYLASAADGRLHVALTGQDFGRTLRAAGLFDTIAGGPFTLSATRPLAAPRTSSSGAGGARYVGKLDVEAFRLVKAPLAARLFAAAALTGLADLASADEGVAFAGLTAPFTYGEGKLDLEPGRAFGSSVGMTWRGGLDFRAETADVVGTLVPFYAVNRVLGAVPLLGDILTGGEGGGLFAVTYALEGPLDEPDLSVNPLSILAPGFLRGLFGAITDGRREDWDPSADPAWQDSGKPN